MSVVNERSFARTIVVWGEHGAGEAKDEVLGVSLATRKLRQKSRWVLVNALSVQVRISTQLLPSIRYEAARGYQVSTREPWNKKHPIMISKDAAPIISFPMKNPTIGTVNTA